MPTATFPEIFNGLFFRLMLRICVQNLNFVVLPILEVIGDTQKIGAVPGFVHSPFLPKLLMGLCSDGPCQAVNVPAKFESIDSPVPEIIEGIQKNLGSPWICPHSLFSEMLMGCCECSDHI